MADALVRRCRPLLGTFVEIAVPMGHEAIVEDAFAAIAHVHARMSFHEETSDLARLRRASIGEAIAVDPDTAAVLRIAQHLYQRSSGLFDVTIGAELAREGFLPVPADTDIDTMTGAGDSLAITDDDRVICGAPMLIDLGGIAKGYAVDRAIDTLAEHGVPRAVVNAGGDLRILGQSAEIVHLREADGNIDLSLMLADVALASSGSLRERRRIGGRWVTPHRGRDRSSVVIADAVSVIARRCVIADAMTKVALADRALAAAMLDELDGAIVERSAVIEAA